jgi:hypothetical protein
MVVAMVALKGGCLGFRFRIWAVPGHPNLDMSYDSLIRTDLGSS